MDIINYYDIIFVELVYRNTTDLRDFFKSFFMPKTKVIVVNSYFDELSEKKFKAIAEYYNADFLSVPNKGYGFGNNRGIEYALKNYKFKYLVISNADILIKKLEIVDLQNLGDGIFAPKLLTLSGKNQNPSCPFVPSILTEGFKYWCYKGNHKKLVWLYYIHSRIKKIIFYLMMIVGHRKIFSAHGAFVIISSNVVKKIYPFYNEEMFLFNEEEHLGRLAKANGIDTYYVPKIIINHKEDGSMDLANIDDFEKMRQSYLIYYKTWIKK